MYVEVLFWKIQPMQIQIYPQTYIETKYDALYLKNKGSAVELNWRVKDLKKKHFFVNSEIFGFRFGGKKHVNYDKFEIATKQCKSNI